MSMLVCLVDYVLQSYEFAVNSSYAHAKANLTVNSTFVDIIRSVSNKRIAMAG